MIAGALLMLLAVMLGAFGAHALRDVLSPRQFTTYQTGVTYHLFHALAVLAVGIVAHVTRPSPWIGLAGVLFVAGIVLFCGSVYALAFGAPKTFGMITPVGGLSFMLGWICVVLHVRTVRAAGSRRAPPRSDPRLAKRRRPTRE
jgi:uncharacterized membrane protein YgdD (TMEM256/DUF423 family)